MQTKAISLHTNVVLHARLRVDLELPRVDRATEAGVVLPGILSIGVTLGVVNVLNREVAADALLGGLELVGNVAVGEEAENEDDVENSLEVGLLERTDVDSLGVKSVTAERVGLCVQLT